MPTKDKEKSRAYRRAWYHRNTKHAKSMVIKRKQAIQEFIRDIKAGKSCLCGESHPHCLDFHHRENTHKVFSISQAAKGGYGRERILDEISKCDLMCANCHRKLTGEIQSWHLNYGD
jgi:trimethylamine:corrinoid methyltransferase-like protein